MSVQAQLVYFRNLPSLKQHLAYSKLSAAWMTFANVDPQRKEIFVKLIPKFANVFVVYRLKSARNFRTAADLVLTLLHEGILGLPMRFGFIHNK